MNAIRNQDAHFSIYNYNIGENNGHFIILPNNKAIIIPEVIFDMISRVSVQRHDGMVKTIEHLIIPTYNIRN